MQDEKLLSDISIKVGQLEVLQESNTKAIEDMAGSINRLIDKLEKSDDLARESILSARSAHHRIDEMNKRIASVENDFKWIFRTTLGAVIAGAIALLFELVKFFN